MKKIWVLALGMFALGMDAYIVAGLIPDMAKSFNKSGEEIGQGVTVFTLFFALSAPILAKYSVKKNIINCFNNICDIQCNYYDIN